MFELRLVPTLILGSFIFVQFLALVAGASLIAQGVTVVENPSDVSNSIFFFLYVIIAAVAILLVLKYYKGKQLFLLLELFLIFFSFQTLSATFVDEWTSLFIGALAVGARLKEPRAKNVLILFVSGAVGAVLGSSLDIIPALVLGLLLAGYDVIAVFYTKHMITLAKQLDKRQAAFSVDVRVKKEAMQLGTGDLVVPAMIAVSALKVSYAAAVSVIIGSTIGLIVLFYFLQKRRGYLPALPPIIGYAIVGLAAYVLA